MGHKDGINEKLQQAVEGYPSLVKHELIQATEELAKRRAWKWEGKEEIIAHDLILNGAFTKG